jgi:hypothetical protein
LCSLSDAQQEEGQLVLTARLSAAKVSFLLTADLVVILNSEFSSDQDFVQSVLDTQLESDAGVSGGDIPIVQLY